MLAQAQSPVAVSERIGCAESCKKSSHCWYCVVMTAKVGRGTTFATVASCDPWQGRAGGPGGRTTREDTGQEWAGVRRRYDR